MTLTPAVGLAAAAGAVAACGLTELAAAWGRAPRRERVGGRWRPLAVAALARAGRGVAGRAPRDLGGRIEVAGVDAGVGDVMAVKAGAAAVVLLATAPLASSLPGRLGPPLCAAAAVAAFLSPDAWLRIRARSRAGAIEEELADVLDLLRVALGAGLTTSRALAEVGRRHPGVLADELRRAADTIVLGSSADSALIALERRCPTPGVPPLVAALRRAARLGSSPTDTLAAQAADARARGALRREEAAARAAPKIQLVIALALVPSVMLLVAAALVPALAGR
jgi:tight adherence protein C